MMRRNYQLNSTQLLILVSAFMSVCWGGVASASNIDEIADSKSESPEAEILMLVSPPGEEKFLEPFDNSIEWMKKAASLSPAPFYLIREADADKVDPRDQFIKRLSSLNVKSQVPLWLVMVGHGTFDGIDAKFNLAGPDIEARELSAMLDGYQRPLVIVLGFSSSSPFMPALSAENRVIISATRSGYESNFSRFGLFFCQSFLDPEADMDKDNQVSLLESFLFASNKTRAFYEDDNRLVSEHSLIDDSGDKKGTPSEWFTGLQPEKSPADAGEIDGFKAHQIILIPDDFERALPLETRTRRNRLEGDLRALKANKNKLTRSNYQSQLEEILDQLAQLYFPASAENEEELSVDASQGDESEEADTQSDDSEPRN